MTTLNTPNQTATIGKLSMTFTTDIAPEALQEQFNDWLITKGDLHLETVTGETARLVMMDCEIEHAESV